MWQYTTETIINENVGNLPNGSSAKVRFGIYSATGNNASGPISTGAGGTVTADDFLIIDGVTSMRVGNIKAIYRTPYEAAKNAKVDITIPTTSITVGSTTYTYATTTSSTAGTLKGLVLRLQVKMHEVGQSSSIFQNAYLKHQKPFHFEIESTGIMEDDIAEFIKVINKTLKLSDFKFFTASKESTGSGSKLRLTAADCYCQFDSVRIDLVGGTKAASEKGGLEDYTEVVKIVAPTSAITAGSEGNGTVARLLKNLRVPTSANTNPFGPDTGGKPIPGGTYDQYMIEYVTDRRHVGNLVMGSVGDQSMTTHVLFVRNTGTVSNGAIASAAGASADFNAIVTKIAGAISGLSVLTGGKTRVQSDGSTTAGEGLIEPKTPTNIGSVE